MLNKSKKKSELSLIAWGFLFFIGILIFGALSLMSKTDIPNDLVLNYLNVATINTSSINTTYFTIEPAVHDDVRVPVSSVTLLGLRNPSWQKFRDNGTTQGVYLLEFSNAAAANQEEVLYTLQLPHSYKEGSDIEMHAHITQRLNESCAVIFTNECTWFNIGDYAPLTTTQKANYTFGAADAHKHGYIDFDVYNGTGKKISSQLVCRLERASGDSKDTCTGGVMLIEVDGHYEIDTLGSYKEKSKY